MVEINKATPHPLNCIHYHRTKSHKATRTFCSPVVASSCSDKRFVDAYLTSWLVSQLVKMTRHRSAIFWPWAEDEFGVPFCQASNPDISQSCEWAIAAYGELPGNKELPPVQRTAVCKSLLSVLLGPFEVRYCGSSNMNDMELPQYNSILSLGNEC